LRAWPLWTRQALIDEAWHGLRKRPRSLDALEKT
jgi:hypothetical protein